MLAYNAVFCAGEPTIVAIFDFDRPTFNGLFEPNLYKSVVTLKIKYIEEDYLCLTHEVSSK